MEKEYAYLSKIFEGKIPFPQKRISRMIELGKDQSNKPFHLSPVSLLSGNLGIAGSSGSGKSWLAGLLVEKFLKLEYQLCIVDPEGDYRGIRAFPHTLLLGGNDTPPPSIVDILTLLEYSNLSLILDLSLYGLEEKIAYLDTLLQAIRALRAKRGKPQWILVDEAHYFCPRDGRSLADKIVDEMKLGGLCLISYRPSLLDPKVLTALDHWMFTRIKEQGELKFLRRLMENPGGNILFDQIPYLIKGQSFVCMKESTQENTSRPGIIEYGNVQRIIPHVRHLHKYLRAPLPQSKQFYFRINEPYDGPTSASSLWEFSEAIPQLPLATLKYHLEHGHFEHWMTKVMYDKELAKRLGKIGKRKLEGELLRQELISTVRSRFEELESLI